MKKFILKDNLTDYEQFLVHSFLSELSLFISEKRRIFLNYGILVEVEV